MLSRQKKALICSTKCFSKCSHEFDKSNDSISSCRHDWKEAGKGLGTRLECYSLVILLVCCVCACSPYLVSMLCVCLSYLPDNIGSPNSYKKEITMCLVVVRWISCCFIRTPGTSKSNQDGSIYLSQSGTYLWLPSNRTLCKNEYLPAHSQ